MVAQRLSINENRRQRLNSVTQAASLRGRKDPDLHGKLQPFRIGRMACCKSPILAALMAVFSGDA